MNRRGLLGLSAALLATGCGRTSARWVSHEPPPEASPVPASDSPQASATPAASPSPSKDSALTRALRRYLSPTPENPGRPMFAGAVAIATVDGAVVDQAAVGDALRYGAGPVELAASQRVAIRMDSVFDLASITKIYTAILVLQQVEKGRLALDAPVASYLSEFDGPGRGGITVAQLLTHTSALPVGAKVTGLSTMEARWSAVLTTPLVGGVKPGSEFRYSSVGLMVAGKLVERATGQSLDQALRTSLLQPLGLKDTGFLPKSWMSESDRAARMVATDARSSRGLLRGVVHDDVCHVLGGVAGHAGVFSTAADLAAIGQMLLGNGVHKGKRVLSEASVHAMVANHNQGLPAVDPERPGRPSDHGLGVTVNQPWLMGRLASAQAYGHTGFTGTSLVVCRRRKLVLVLLTNRAHPNWSWANPDPVRVATSNLFAG